MTTTVFSGHKFDFKPLDFVKHAAAGVGRFFMIWGYARAVSELSQNGMHEEAKALMLSIPNKK